MKKEETVGGNTLLCDVLLKYSQQDSLLLVKRQTNKSMAQYQAQTSDPHKYGQLIFDKGIKVLAWRKDEFSTNDAEEN